ncbi:A-kinase anchor protein 1, mitochondrial-like isoform X2 [Stegodyphus dumicola]|uniref:A-kinase anchor protein 1, mitochondrial-like isoform X2 n=1 Tax=Stegodyphus dumicola TaxID=202533 RepID=UPI0015AFBDF4|nr:A-kinase anchor protein 1, mitochondrial-like isoform X2 [Stegodyphus dumicola]
MANFNSRNVLICVAPAVILFLSVYWLRKKKKIKNDEAATIETKCDGKYNNVLDSPDTSIDSCVECNYKFADIISDSSEASKESSKSARTQNDPLVTVPKTVVDSFHIKNIPSSSFTEITGNQIDNFEIVRSNLSDIKNSQREVLPNISNLKNSETNASDTQENFEINPQIENDVELNNSCNILLSKISNRQNSYIVQKSPVQNDSIFELKEEKCKLENGTLNLSSDELTCAAEFEEKTNRNCKQYEKLCLDDAESAETTSAIPTGLAVMSDALVSVKSESKEIDTQIDKNVLASHALEEYQLNENDSYGSQSSVLDESSSFSCTSEECDSKQVIESKTKSSSSGIMDESSSFCDELEKTFVESPNQNIMKSESLNGNRDSVEISQENTEAAIDNSILGHVSIQECIKQSRDPGSFGDAETERLSCESLQEQLSSSFSSLTATSDCNISSTLELSSEQSLYVSFVEPTDPVSSDIESLSDVKLPEDQQLEESESVLLNHNVLPVCDNLKKESNCNLSVQESVLFETASTASAFPENVGHDSSNCQLSVVEPVDSISPLVCTSAATISCTNDNETAEMNNSSQCVVASNIETVAQVSRTSLDNANWKMQDNQLQLLNQSKIGGTDVSDSKAPESSCGSSVYEFELPQELCGRLIGKHGKHVKSIKERSNANVYIKRHPYDPQLKIVAVQGSQSDVNNALEIIRRKFPPSQFPTVTLVQTNLVNSHGLPLPESLQLHLPDGASCDVILSSLISAGHFFLQQPTHPTYPSLSTLDQCMMNCYSQLDTPLLPHPVEAGVICAAPVLRGWYRAQVIFVFDSGTECEIKFVDYGGFSQVPTNTLRQIRSDFMTLPFQASECYLANVSPVDSSEGWSAEATATFEELAQGQILQAVLVEYAEDGIPCVHLYRVQGISNMFINRELVERGFAVWVDSSHWDPH